MSSWSAKWAGYLLVKAQRASKVRKWRVLTVFLRRSKKFYVNMLVFSRAIKGPDYSSRVVFSAIMVRPSRAWSLVDSFVSLSLKISMSSCI